MSSNGVSLYLNCRQHRHHVYISCWPPASMAAVQTGSAECCTHRGLRHSWRTLNLAILNCMGGLLAKLSILFSSNIILDCKLISFRERKETFTITIVRKEICSLLGVMPYLYLPRLFAMQAFLKRSSQWVKTPQRIASHK